MLQSILHQRRLSSCRWLVSGLPVCALVFWSDLESDLQGGWDIMLSKLACYCSPNLPTLYFYLLHLYFKIHLHLYTFLILMIPQQKE